MTTKTKALSSTASVVQPIEEVISETAVRKIDFFLMRMPRLISDWTTEHIAALLVGIRARLERAFAVMREYGVTPNMRAKWGKRPRVQEHYQRLITA